MSEEKRIGLSLPIVYYDDEDFSVPQTEDGSSPQDAIANFVEDLNAAIQEYDISVVQHWEGDATVVVRRKDAI